MAVPMTCEYIDTYIHIYVHMLITSQLVMSEIVSFDIWLIEMIDQHFIGCTRRGWQSFYHRRAGKELCIARPQWGGLRDHPVTISTFSTLT